MTRINGWACFFLVSLRLVIGWHFLVEGAYKIHTHWVGKTATNTPWTSEGFFKEGYGPSANVARRLLGEDDRARLAFFSADRGSQDRDRDWEGYYKHFITHYPLSPEQAENANRIYTQKHALFNQWINGETSSPVKTTLVWGPEVLNLTVPQRIAEIERRLNEIDDLMRAELPAFNQDVEKGRIRTLKSEVSNMIADLFSDYQSKVADMRAALTSVLTDEQKKREAPPDLPPTNRLPLILDHATMGLHAILGALLVIGLFTRLSSFFLALFLLTVTLLAPAVPWAPAPPGSVGHYLYINLYTIEMIALFALASMPTGKWFGLDALFARSRKPKTRVNRPGRMIPTSARR